MKDQMLRVFVLTIVIVSALGLWSRKEQAGGEVVKFAPLETLPPVLVPETEPHPRDDESVDRTLSAKEQPIIRDSQDGARNVEAQRAFDREERRFASEEVDASWAFAQERAIAEAFTGVKYDGIDFQGVECGTKLCRTEFRVGHVDALETLLNEGIPETPLETAGRVILDPEDSSRLLVFSAREGLHHSDAFTQFD